jgi:hypothetical protein
MSNKNKPTHRSYASKLSGEFDQGYKNFLKKRGLPMPKKWSAKPIASEKK